MALSLTKTSDAIHRRLTMLIYGHPGVGKTSLVNTLTASDDKILYVAADPGQLALRKRAIPCVHLTAKPMADLRDLYQLASTTDKYEWIVLDGLDELGAAVLKESLVVNKHGIKAYGDMADFMRGFAENMRDIKHANVLFISHIAGTQDDSGRFYYGPSFPGKALTADLPKMFDLIGCMRLLPDATSKNRRMIQFSSVPDDRYIAKDRSGVLADFEEPDLSAIFAKIHGAGMGQIKEEPKTVADMLSAVGKKLQP